MVILLFLVINVVLFFFYFVKDAHSKILPKFLFHFFLKIFFLQLNSMHLFLPSSCMMTFVCFRLPSLSLSLSISLELTLLVDYFGSAMSFLFKLFDKVAWKKSDFVLVPQVGISFSVSINLSSDANCACIPSKTYLFLLFINQHLFILTRSVRYSVYEMDSLLSCWQWFFSCPCNLRV